MREAKADPFDQRESDIEEEGREGVPKLYQQILQESDRPIFDQDKGDWVCPRCAYIVWNGKEKCKVCDTVNPLHRQADEQGADEEVGQEEQEGWQPKQKTKKKVKKKIAIDEHEESESHKAFNQARDDENQSNVYKKIWP